MIQEAIRATKNTISILLIKGTEYLILLLFILIIPRLMGPGDYGNYAFIMSIIVAVTLIADLGTVNIFGRFIPEMEEKKQTNKIKKLLAQTIKIKFLVGLLLLILYITILSTLNIKNLKLTYLIITGLALLFFIIAGNLFSFLFGKNEIIKYSLRNLFRRILTLVFLILLYTKFRIIGIYSTILITSIILFMFALIWTIKYIDLKIKLDIKFLKPYLKFGVILFLSTAIITVFHNLGNIMTQLITKSSREVTFFDLPNQGFFITLMLLNLLIFSLAPTLTKFAIKRKKNKINKWLRMMTKYSVALSVFTIAIIIFLGNDVIQIIYGLEFSKIYINAVIIFLSIIPFIIVINGLTIATVYKKPKNVITPLIIGLIFYIIISVLLIIRYASFGTSLGVFAASMLFGILIFIYNKHHLIGPTKELIKSILPAAIMLPLFFIRGGIMFNMLLLIFFIIVYVLIMFLTKLINKKEIKEIIKAIKS